MECNPWLFLIVTTLCINLSGQADLEQLSNPSLPVPDKLINNMAYAVNNFGYKLLLKMMNEKKNENIVISPTGIAVVHMLYQLTPKSAAKGIRPKSLLSMTLLGSVGRTYDEIAEVLGFSQDIFTNRKNHEQLGDLLQSLNTNVSSKTLYADAMIVDVQTPLRDLYRNYLQDVYHGEVLGTDFKQTEEAKNVINQWVNNHTEGQIENFLKGALPSSTKLVLLSAIYFRGQWEHPFVPEYTAKMPFKKHTGDVIADLMLNFGQFPYTISENREYVMLALPYNDSETTMYALKPRLPKKLQLLELMERLDFEKIDNTINAMTDQKCVVRFPKMELKSSVSLENTLKDLGMRDMFIPGKANFALMVNENSIVNKTEEELITRISNSEEESRGIKRLLDNLPNPGIHVDSVMHDVKMTINEYGTEAVAATSAVLARTAEQFYADTPFYIFIRNNKTKLVTFSAVIFDPTESRA